MLQVLCEVVLDAAMNIKPYGISEDHDGNHADDVIYGFKKWSESALHVYNEKLRESEQHECNSDCGCLPSSDEDAEEDEDEWDDAEADAVLDHD